MDRRLALTALAGVLAAPTLALAQATAPGAGMTAAGSAADSAHRMGETEMKHAMQTAMAGMFAMEHAKIGVEKARNAEVKRFGQLEVAEQTTIAEVLKSMMTGMDMPKLPAEKLAMLKKMEGMSAGADFDKMFLEGQHDGHEELLKIQDAYINAGKNREHLAVAKLARGHIREHLSDISHIQGMLKA